MGSIWKHWFDFLARENHVSEMFHSKSTVWSWSFVEMTYADDSGFSGGLKLTCKCSIADILPVSSTLLGAWYRHQNHHCSKALFKDGFVWKWAIAKINDLSSFPNEIAILMVNSIFRRIHVFCFVGSTPHHITIEYPTWSSLCRRKVML